MRRDVTTTISPLAAVSRSATRSRAPNMCSKLSRTSSTRRGRRCSITRVSTGTGSDAIRPSASPMAAANWTGWPPPPTECSETTITPSLYCRDCGLANSSRRLCSTNSVLPMPPGPATVRRRQAGSPIDARTRSTSCPRPTNGWVRAGRLLAGVTANSEGGATGAVWTETPGCVPVRICR